MPTDPWKGPQTSGWKKYDPDDTTTLALLGNSLTGAELGDHFTADSTCDFWNEVLPIYPQVSGCRLASCRNLFSFFVCRHSRLAAAGRVDKLERCRAP